MKELSIEILLKRKRFIAKNCSKSSSLSSSSCRTASTDLSDPLLSPISIVHRYREVFKATSSVGTELL